MACTERYGAWVDTSVDRARFPDAHALLALLLGDNSSLPPFEGVEGLLRLAGRNRVLGELRARLGPEGPPSLTGPLLARWMVVAARNRVKADAARALGVAFADAGVECVALKGLHLAHAVYREPGDRPFGDLDLLVRPRDRDVAESVLVANGYEPGLAQTGDGAMEASFARTFKPDVLVDVDLHWRLVGDLSLVRRMCIDTEGLFTRSGPGWPGIRFPAPEDAMIIGAVNLVRHGFRPLGNILDLREILRLCDPTALVDRARASRTRSAVAAGLGLAAALFQAEIPDQLALDLPLPPWQGRSLRALLPMSELVRPERMDGPVARYVLKVLAQDGARGVVGTVAGLPRVIARRSRGG